MSKIDQLNGLLAASPNDSFLQHALALENIKMGNDAEAKTLFETILERDAEYVGSYYHLGKLNERLKDYKAAIAIYKKGMAEAKKAKDNHSYNELQAALEDIEDEL